MSGVPDTVDDPRLLRAAQEYLAELEAGRTPDRVQFLAQHADIAAALGPYLDALDALHGLQEPARSTVPMGPPPLPPLSGAAPLVPNMPLGDFRIIREIGRGGMGVVYEAEQLSLGRHIALKVLPFAAAFDVRQLQRFKNEAQAAAQLHHTHIVPVYAVGCERGVHFYAMQLIDGQTLAALIESLREQRAAPQEGSPPGQDTVAAATTVRLTGGPRTGTGYYRTAATWMVQAALALDHAHQHGVVHRDIKPANLLVDYRGHLWVTDFGLAQFQMGADLTQTGDLLGTLRYMSPEQASGQRVPLDPRTDIYSLGATFYELVTLEPIFASTNRTQLLHQIIRDEPRPPRQVERSVPVELETILLKALSKNPSERYASGAELAADLERFLDNRPILARRPSLVERLRKWSRRHPSLVIAGLVLLAFCLAGLVVNNALVSREQRRTNEALERERDRAELAERRLGQTRELVDVLIQLCEEDLSDMMPLQGVRKRLLETALAHYQEFLDQSRADPIRQAELAATHARVRKILTDLATLQGAGDLILLISDAVMAELKPSEEQQKQVRALTEWFREERRKMVFTDKPLSAEERRRRQLEIARKGEADLARILDEQQRRRLHQISLQARGLLAFHEPEVINALSLTPGQRQRIREIESELFFSFQPQPPPPPRPGPPPDFPRPPHGPPGPPGARFRAALDRCLALLTPAQRQRWQELTGEPLDSALFFGPFSLPR